MGKRSSMTFYIYNVVSPSSSPRFPLACSRYNESALLRMYHAMLAKVCFKPYLPEQLISLFFVSGVGGQHRHVSDNSQSFLALLLGCGS
jgi:hypothetical protein